MNANSAEELLGEARRVLNAESRAIEGLASRIGADFVRAVEILAGAHGRVIVAGIGKSGIIGRKIAATLTSTGTPATYLHPVEGLHGDLGIVGREDVAVLISKSGDTSELAGLIDYLTRLGVPIIALTGDPGSSLGKASTVVLDCSVEEEACPLDLAPTTSTTATLAMGDALAVVLLQKKGFRAEDFALLHPGGSLGRKLTLRVEEVMVGDDYPSRGGDALIRDCIVPLAKMRGTVPIVDGEGRVVGVVTAGDLTRLMGNKEDFLDVPVREVMTRTPKLARVGELASAAVHVMEKHGIMALPVVDEGNRLKGIVHLHDLMRSGAV
ncbi:MAG: KpsF/GutQ family sugar-phosphate isomerase [Longimicrobiales bacterium]|nr:KpsF/GutQ family sugar-phosphate isomerase [Longimicrobiales bacterium]